MWGRIGEVHKRGHPALSLNKLYRKWSGGSPPTWRSQIAMKAASRLRVNRAVSMRSAPELTLQTQLQPRQFLSVACQPQRQA